MAGQNPLRDPRIEPLDPAPRASDAYLHRAARMAVLLALPALATASDWPRLRGPRGSRVGVERSMSSSMPTPAKSLVWRREIPAGASSPLVLESRIFLTGMDGDDLAVVCVEASTGEGLWQRKVSLPAQARVTPSQTPATPTPISDGSALYLFLPEVGLLAYSLDRDELWRRDESASPPPNLEGRMGAWGTDAEAEMLAMADVIQAPPVVAGGCLYLRTSTALYCFGDPG